jgi:hypothetical protein
MARLKPRAARAMQPAIILMTFALAGCASVGTRNRMSVEPSTLLESSSPTAAAPSPSVAASESIPMASLWPTAEASNLELGPRTTHSSRQGNITELRLIQSITNHGVRIQDLAHASSLHAVLSSGAAVRAQVPAEQCPRYLGSERTGYVLGHARVNARVGAKSIVVTLTRFPVDRNPDAVLSVRKLRLTSTEHGGTRASGVAVNDGDDTVHSALVCVVLHGKSNPTFAVTTFYPIGPIYAHKSLRFATDQVAAIARNRVSSAEAFVVADW